MNAALPAGCLLLAGSAAVALFLAFGGETARAGAGIAALGTHAALFILGLLLVAVSAPRPFRLPLAAAGLLVIALGALELLPPLRGGARTTLVYAHVALGALVLGTAGYCLALRAPGSLRRQHAALAGVLALVLTPVAGYFAGEQRRAAWQPPRYDAQACYRFLTATTPDQSGEPLFPSAIRPAAGTDQGGADAGCTRAGCHAGIPATHAHAFSAGGPAYQATLADFTHRRGEEAARWCRGCHEGADAAAMPSAIRTSGLGCTTCHAVTQVHALYGSAPLVLGKVPGAADMAANARLRPKAHAGMLLRPELHRSAAFCAACHRKNFNLPQNGFRWVPGPDEYQDWASSAYSGSALYAASIDGGPKSCLGCHSAHRGNTPLPSTQHPAPASPLTLDLFFRAAATGAPSAEVVGRSAPPRPGARAYLDVVVRNRGIGHDFPTGMPDLWNTWLEVEVRDARGRVVGSSGSPRARDRNAAHGYRLRPLDRSGRPVPPGRLDEMA
ncbi:MAG TPA: hypothetical protein VFU47_10920, partial [Armatimonadota bacterium]|nr:hypothetical protein [Armatimonadota bacterium]